mgnify:CR=1 FL=1
MKTLSLSRRKRNRPRRPKEAAAQPAQEEAPAEKSFDEMSFSEALEASLQSMNTDQKVKGTVVGMSPSEIQVDIGRKHAGYIPLDEFSADPTVNPLEAVKVGDVLDLIIMKPTMRRALLCSPKNVLTRSRRGMTL